MIEISLRACRINAKLSRNELAQKLGVSYATIVSWELGKTQPKLDQIRKYSEICGIPIEYINA